MVGVGVFVAWLGYSLFYYGLDQIRGGNNGLLSLMIPGKYSDQPKDSGATPDTGTTTGTTALGPASTKAIAQGKVAAPTPTTVPTEKRYQSWLSKL
jgi:hypothetical protein